MRELRIVQRVRCWPSKERIRGVVQRKYKTNEVYPGNEVSSGSQEEISSWGELGRGEVSWEVPANLGGSDFSAEGLASAFKVVKYRLKDRLDILAFLVARQFGFA